MRRHRGRGRGERRVHVWIERVVEGLDQVLREGEREHELGGHSGDFGCDALVERGGALSRQQVLYHLTTGHVLAKALVLYTRFHL